MSSNDASNRLLRDWGPCVYYLSWPASGEAESDTDTDEAALYKYESQKASQTQQRHREIFQKVKGMFITLSQVSSNVLAEKTRLTSLTLMGDSSGDVKRHESASHREGDTDYYVAFHQQLARNDSHRTGILVLVLPADYFHPYEVIQTCDKLARLLKFLFMRSLTVAFADEAHHGEINSIIQLLEDCLDSSSVLDPLFALTVPRLIIEEDFTLYMDDLLNEYESMEWLPFSHPHDTDEKEPTGTNPIDYLSIGSAVFYENHLTVSHLSPSLLSHVIFYLYAKELFRHDAEGDTRSVPHTKCVITGKHNEQLTVDWREVHIEPPIGQQQHSNVPSAVSGHLLLAIKSGSLSFVTVFQYIGPSISSQSAHSASQQHPGAHCTDRPLNQSFTRSGNSIPLNPTILEETIRFVQLQLTGSINGIVPECEAFLQVRDKFHALNLISAASSHSANNKSNAKSSQHHAHDHASSSRRIEMPSPSSTSASTSSQHNHCKWRSYSSQMSDLSEFDSCSLSESLVSSGSSASMILLSNGVSGGGMCQTQTDKAAASQVSNDSATLKKSGHENGFCQQSAQQHQQNNKLNSCNNWQPSTGTNDTSSIDRQGCHNSGRQQQQSTSELLLHSPSPSSQLSASAVMKCTSNESGHHLVSIPSSLSSRFPSFPLNLVYYLEINMNSNTFYAPPLEFLVARLDSQCAAHASSLKRKWIELFGSKEMINSTLARRATACSDFFTKLRYGIVDLLHNLKESSDLQSGFEFIADISPPLNPSELRSESASSNPSQHPHQHHNNLSMELMATILPLASIKRKKPFLSSHTSAGLGIYRNFWLHGKRLGQNQFSVICSLSGKLSVSSSGIMSKPPSGLAHNSSAGLTSSSTSSSAAASSVTHQYRHNVSCDLFCQNLHQLTQLI